MKKTLLALTVASLAATSVNAAEIYKSEDGSADFYGQLRQELKFSDSNDHKADLSSGSSRMGVKGAYTIFDGVDAVGLVELGVSDSDITNRLHYVGIQGDFGTLTFGKQWNATDDVWGADYSYFYGGSALRGEILNGGRHDSSIKYTFDGDNFWVKSTYGLNEGDKNLDMFDLFVGASFGDLALHTGGGYTNDNKQNYTNELSHTYAEFTAEYTLGDLLLGGTYYWSQVQNESGDGKIVENAISLAGTYSINDKASVYAGYELTMHSPTDVSNSAGAVLTDDEDGTVIYVGTAYVFNAHARVYAEYGYGDGTTLGYTAGNDAKVEAQRADGESNFGIGARFYW